VNAKCKSAASDVYKADIFCVGFRDAFVCAISLFGLLLDRFAVSARSALPLCTPLTRRVFAIFSLGLSFARRFCARLCAQTRSRLRAFAAVIIVAGSFAFAWHCAAAHRARAATPRLSAFSLLLRTPFIVCTRLRVARNAHTLFRCAPRCNAARIVSR